MHKSYYKRNILASHYKRGKVVIPVHSGRPTTWWKNDVLDDIFQTNEVDVSILDMYSLKCWEVDRKLNLQRVHTFRDLAFQSGEHETVSPFHGLGTYKIWKETPLIHDLGTCISSSFLNLIKHGGRHFADSQTLPDTVRIENPHLASTWRQCLVAGPMAISSLHWMAAISTGSHCWKMNRIGQLRKTEIEWVRSNFDNKFGPGATCTGQYRFPYAR